MKGKQRTPQYAVRLVILNILGATTFFGGLRLFIPEDRKGQIYTLMIFKYLRSAQYICRAVMFEVNSWRNFGKMIYRRNAL